MHKFTFSCERREAFLVHLVCVLRTDTMVQEYKAKHLHFTELIFDNELQFLVMEVKQVVSEHCFWLQTVFLRRHVFWWVVLTFRCAASLAFYSEDRGYTVFYSFSPSWNKPCISALLGSFTHKRVTYRLICFSELCKERCLTCFSRSVRLPSLSNDDVTYRANQSQLRVGLETAVVDTTAVDHCLQDATSCCFRWYCKWHNAMPCDIHIDTVFCYCSQ